VFELSQPLASLSPASARRQESRMQLQEVISRVRRVHWIVASVATLLVDYITGPFIQFPILFVVPVALATAAQGFAWGAFVAILLPLFRLSFFLKWNLPSSLAFAAADTAVDVAILLWLAALISYVIRQQRTIRVLEGLLPICSFCKRIRDEAGEWRQLESFIGERSAARFSHTFCEQCGRSRYPGMFD
jgi:hypothetical protein